jgi:hypothetical protein
MPWKLNFWKKPVLTGFYTLFMRLKMGSAAYRRGSKAIAEQLNDNTPPEWYIMNMLNDLKKNPNAGTPLKNVAITHDDRGFWSVECAEKRERGFGYHGYQTLRNVVRNWNIIIIGCEFGKVWIGKPFKK